MRRIVALSLLLLGIALVHAPAEAVPSCMGAGDVTLLGSAGCVQGGLQFMNFAVSPAGVAAKILLGTFSSVTGQDVNLNFQISHSPSPANLADILLYYTAQTISGVADIGGVDLFNPGHNVTIREAVCGTPFDGGVCASGLLADLVVPANSSLATPLTSVQSLVYIRKDIQLLEDSFISEFTNSHDLASTPEPATLVLLGSSFATLGVALRRRLAARRDDAGYRG
jgi:PEP-CTERM motif-containing protein